MIPSRQKTLLGLSPGKTRTPSYPLSCNTRTPCSSLSQVFSANHRSTPSLMSSVLVITLISPTSDGVPMSVRASIGIALFPGQP
ncbi:Protein of unknown function [Propionibacterium freudenreichii subsp. freudenreichii]|uniref:Uncharacterized protein n=1 Tax=Propionibacterium freudenreichii subsp. freudenreichii TaxID=66712 RepID=A0A0B7NUM2_PROFF|nr:Protein of unknown function [Propionibacterium freudenreichii subsp. freudenreichii]